MAVFTAIAAAIGGAIGLAGTALTVFTAIGATVLSVGVSSLVAKNAAKGSSGGPGGGRVQIPPATDNKIPVIYGSAFVGGPVIDANISNDLKTMWYVVALAEHTDTTAGSGYIFDQSNIYYNGKLVQFGFNGAVTGLINNTPSQTEIDTKVNGKIFIYLFPNGSNSGVNTGGQAAYDIMPNWTSNDSMTNCAFAIVKVFYDTKAGTTSLGGLMCKITNSLDTPGSVIKDYLINTRYGCGIPLTRIDTDSLTALDVYSNETINYGTGTQARYRINGPISTGESCLNNLQYLTNSCDSWLQYSELTGKWKVVINQSYTDYTTIDDLFLVNSYNLIGGINIAPINLNETYNELEVAYPNQYIKDQTDYQVIELSDYEPDVLSPNEAINRLNVDFGLVNNSVQALYLGVRKLLQSREDLTVTFRLDYSGIQIDSGDVIRIKHDEYGWDVLNSGKGKLFRVASVAEEKYQDGSLGVFISAFEYNDTIYADRALLDFQPDPNTGLTDPNIFSTVDIPTIEVYANGTVNYMKITGNVPTTGLTRYLEFNYGFDSNVDNHFFYTTITNSNGAPLLANSSYFVDVSDVPGGNIYWSLTARNDFVGQNSNAAGPATWAGPSVTETVIDLGSNVNSNGNILTGTFNTMPCLGGTVEIIGGTGQFSNSVVIINTVTDLGNNIYQVAINDIPSVALSSAEVEIQCGGIIGANIQGNAVTYTNINSGANPASRIAALAFNTVGPNSTVIVPTQVSSNNFNVPIYLDGTARDANYLTPWVQGTASTANGFVANSTGRYTPLDSKFQIITNAGEDGWWPAIFISFANTPAYPLSNLESFQSFFEGTFYSNIDSVIQIAPFYTANGYPGQLIINSELQSMAILAGDTEFQVQLNSTYEPVANNTIEGGGILFRNIIANSRVELNTAKLELNRARYV